MRREMKTERYKLNSNNYVGIVRTKNLSLLQGEKKKREIEINVVGLLLKKVSVV